MNKKLLEAAREIKRSLDDEIAKYLPEKEKTVEEKLSDLDAYIKDKNSEIVPESPKLPDTPEYERMVAEGMSDEEIAKKAEESLASYVHESTKAIDKNIESAEKELEENRKQAEKGYAESEESLARIYGEAKENMSNDLLKRGLARSSITGNIMAGLESELGEKRAAALAGYVERVNEIDGEISTLATKRQEALSDFNIAYAAKLTEEINKLTEKREENLKEVLKYNNTLTEKEYNNKVDKIMDESDLYTEKLTQTEKERELANIPESQQLKLYEDVYGKMDEILSSLSKSEAKTLILNNSIFKDNLNDYYYYRLYDKYCR